MSKQLLRKRKMTAAVYIDDARDKARQLILWETRFPGDAGPAMKRVADRLHVPVAKLFALKYRAPKDIGVSVYAAIIEAHEAAVQAQADRFAAERAATAPRTALGRFLVRTAASLAGEGCSALNDGGDA
jgi:hypothetical protein